MGGFGLCAFGGGVGAFLGAVKGCIGRSGTGDVHDGDKAKELAVCGLAMSVDRGRGLLRSGMLMLRPRWLGDLDFVEAGREL